MHAKPWLLFWFFAACCSLYFVYSLYRTGREWSVGLKTGFSLKDFRGKALKIWLSEVFLQRQLFSLSITRWLIHQCLFWGFLGLVFLSALKVSANVLGVISPGRGLPVFLASGVGYSFTKAWGNSFGLILLAGSAASLIRRFVLRSPQVAGDQTDTMLTAYLLLMTLSGFVLEGLRLSISPPEAAQFAFIGRLFMLSHPVITKNIETWLAVIWILHGFSGVAILVYLPHSKLMHSLLGPMVIALNASEEQGRKDMYWPKTGQYRQTK